MSIFPARAVVFCESVQEGVPTDNEALKSICRLLGLRADNPTLGSQHAICLHLFLFLLVISHPSEQSKNHATSHVNLNAKSAVRIYMLCRLTMGFITSECYARNTRKKDNLAF